jgi:hypothetical protein
MTEKVMALIRKQKKRQQNRLRYNKSRPEYLAASLSRTKPWTKKGISRATWYRQRETSQRQVNLNKAVLVLVSTENKHSTESECDRVATATPAGQTRTYVRDGFLTADEAAWLLSVSA